MADTTAIDFFIPAHKGQLQGLRTLVGHPVVLPVASTARLILGVYDELGAFEATPAGTNLVAKVHAINADLSLGSELVSVSGTIATTTEAAWKAGTGHAALKIPATTLTAASYAGGGIVRLSLWIDSIMIKEDVVIALDTGSTVTVGGTLASTLSILQAQARAYYTPTAASLYTNLVANMLAANSEYLSITDGAQTGLDVGTADFSLSLWFLATDISGTKVLASKGNASSTALGWSLFLTNATLTWRNGDGTSTAEVTETVLAGKWYHVLATADRDGNMQMWVDAVSAGTATALSSTMDNASPLHLGASATPGSYHGGKLAMVIFWPSTLLSSGNATTLYNSGEFLSWGNMGGLAAGAAGVWELNETSGTRADQSGNSNDLTDNNTVTADFRRKSASFFASASSNHLDISDASQTGLDGVSALTITAWVKIPSGSGVSEGIIGKWGPGTDRSYLLEKTIAGGITAYIRTSTSGTVSIGKITGVDNAWHLVALVWDGSVLKSSIDGGAFGSTATATGTLVASTYPFAIGEYGNGNFLDGSVGDSAFWSRALTLVELQAVHQDGRGLNHSELTAALATGLVSWWALGTLGTRIDLVAAANNLADNGTTGLTTGVLPDNDQEYLAPVGAGITRWTNSATLGSDEFGDLFCIDPTKAPTREADGLDMTSLEGLYTAVGTASQAHSLVFHATIDTTGLQFLCDGWQVGQSGYERSVIYDDGNSINLYTTTDATDAAFTPVTGEQVFIGNFNGTSSELHVDDNSKTLTPTSPGVDGLEGFAVGTRFNRASPLKGTMHLAVIMPRVLTSGEITEIQTELIP